MPSKRLNTGWVTSPPSNIFLSLFSCIVSCSFSWSWHSLQEHSGSTHSHHKTFLAWEILSHLSSNSQALVSHVLGVQGGISNLSKMGVQYSPDSRYLLNRHLSCQADIIMRCYRGTGHPWLSGSSVYFKEGRLFPIPWSPSFLLQCNVLTYCV